MKRTSFHLLTAALASFLSCCAVLSAQPAGAVGRRLEAGGIFSTKGSGITLSIPMKDGGSGEVRVLADFEDFLTSHEVRPGTRVELYRNFVLREREVSEDLTVRLIAGPGIAGGLVRDDGKEAGILMALCLDGGAELAFGAAPVTVFFGFSAHLGAHLVYRDQYDNTMSFYTNGLRRIWMPEIAIKYRF